MSNSTITPLRATAASQPVSIDVRAAVTTMLPLIAAYAPFALVIGATVAASRDPLAGWAGSWLIFGGSAHLATLETLGEAGPLAAIIAGSAVNARLVVYSASLTRHWQHQPGWFRAVAAGLIIDPTWAAAERHATTCTDPRRQRWFFISAGITLGVGWSGLIAIGALLGSRLDLAALAVVAPLCLLALIGDRLRQRRSLTVIGAASVVATVTTSLPAGSGLLLAIVTGCLAGSAVDRRLR